jgi:hypothetical protein
MIGHAVYLEYRFEGEVLSQDDGFCVLSQRRGSVVSN